MDPVAIVLLTYATDVDSARAQYARRTMHHVASKLSYSGPLHLHIADDGSPVGHIKALIKEAQLTRKDWAGISSTSSYRRGYGASYNLATQHLHSDFRFYLMLEDDWELTQPLNLDPLVAALIEGHHPGHTPDLGCIRLGYLGWTQPLFGQLYKYGGQTFLMFDQDSREPHVWAGHPRFETRDWQRLVGPWPEGLDPGSTEFDVTGRDEARRGVGWPMDLGIRASQELGCLFAHIGAVQAREDQKE